MGGTYLEPWWPGIGAASGKPSQSVLPLWVVENANSEMGMMGIKQDLQRSDCSRPFVPNLTGRLIGTVGVWCFSLNLIADILDCVLVASITVGNLTSRRRYPPDLLRRHL
jgi:hypothetical protein